MYFAQDSNYFDHLNLQMRRKLFMWLFHTSHISMYTAIHLPKFLHTQSLFSMLSVACVRCSFWVQWKKRGEKVFPNGNMANDCVQWPLSESFPRVFSRKMSAAYILVALKYGEISPWRLLQHVLAIVYIFLQQTIDSPL